MKFGKRLKIDLKYEKRLEKDLKDGKVLKINSKVGERLENYLRAGKEVRKRFERY